MSEEQSSDPDRADINQWKHPTFDYDKHNLYNPFVWLVLIPIDIANISRWWIWHRFQSAKGNREKINNELIICHQSLSAIERSEELTPYQEEQLQQIKESIDEITDELNITSDQLAQYANKTDSEMEAND